MFEVIADHHVVTGTVSFSDATGFVGEHDPILRHWYFFYKEIIKDYVDDIVDQEKQFADVYIRYWTSSSHITIIQAARGMELIVWESEFTSSMFSSVLNLFS